MFFKRKWRETSGADLHDQISLINCTKTLIGAAMAMFQDDRNMCGYQ
jgi:hypothetical protein